MKSTLLINVEKLLCVSLLLDAIAVRMDVFDERQANQSHYVVMRSILPLLLLLDFNKFSTIRRNLCIWIARYELDNYVDIEQGNNFLLE